MFFSVSTEGSDDTGVSTDNGVSNLGLKSGNGLSSFELESEPEREKKGILKRVKLLIKSSWKAFKERWEFVPHIAETYNITA